MDKKLEIENMIYMLAKSYSTNQVSAYVMANDPGMTEIPENELVNDDFRGLENALECNLKLLREVMLVRGIKPRIPDYSRLQEALRCLADKNKMYGYDRDHLLTIARCALNKFAGMDYNVEEKYKEMVGYDDD